MPGWERWEDSFQEYSDGIVWPGRPFLSDSNLAHHVKALRRKLGDDSLIKTAVGEGYYLTVPVTVVPDCGDGPSPGIPLRDPTFTRRRTVSITALILGVLIAVGFLQPRGNGLHATGYLALTNDGRPKRGPLLSDGHRLIFMEQIEGKWMAVSVPISGGDASILDIPLSIARIHDVATDGSALLLSTYEGASTKLWSWPLTGGVPQIVSNECGDAGWAPDRRMIACGENTSLVIASSGAIRTKAVGSQFARVLNPRWSPDGARISFTLQDPKNVTGSLWTADGRGKKWERIAQTSASGDDQADGAWTADGQYFVFEAGSTQRHDLWVIPRADRSWGSYFGTAARVTNGPLNWKWPIPAKGRSQIFAFGESLRGELVRFDLKSGIWNAYLGGIAAYQIDFSRDGKWMTYSRYPEHTIWKAKADGSERVQLTTQEYEAHQPHWSPDGHRIAFMARKPGRSWRVMTLEVANGAVDEPIPEGEEQGVPTWSSDGHSLVFGELLFVKDPASMAIRIFNRQTGRLSVLPESTHLSTPRWSPDGNYVSALSADGTTLLSSRCCWSEWKTILGKGERLDDPMWSPDSKYIFLMGRLGSSRPQLLKVAVPDGRLQHIADITDFPTTNEHWFGLAPDGSTLALKGVRLQEIYALDCKLP